MTYLKDLLSKINKQANGISGKQFREFADINKPNSYLPNNHVRYQYCVGSSPQYRGYPCALWLLFHTLTVSQVESGIYIHLLSSFLFYLFSICPESAQMHILEIPSAIKLFIKHFFGCRHCSENFMKETTDLNQLDSNNKHAAIIYLWKSNI
jgi:thiol oxidase